MSGSGKTQDQEAFVGRPTTFPRVHQWRPVLPVLLLRGMILRGVRPFPLLGSAVGAQLVRGGTA